MDNVSAGSPKPQGLYGPAGQIHRLQDIPVTWLGTSVLMLVVAACVSFVYTKNKYMRPFPQFPVVSFPEDGLTPKQSWLFRGKELIEKGHRLYPRGFQIMQSSGPRIILPNKYAEEIKKVPGWTFGKWISREFFPNYPGMEPFGDGGTASEVFHETVRVKVTQSLTHVTGALSEEVAGALEKIFGSNYDEWGTSHIKHDASDIVARMSARVFLGEKLSKNEEWVRISQDYSADAFQASKDMRAWHPLILPVAHWFIPSCIAVRKQMARARQIIDPEVKERIAAHDAAIAKGEKPNKLYDAVSWILDSAKGRPVDVAVAQLAFAAVAIATTSELTSFCLLDLCVYPQYIQPLREEIIRVLTEDGWAKTSLYKMKLMDSFIKESQRFHPVQWSMMRRWTEKEVTLSDGIVIPAHASVSVTMENMNDPKRFPDPERFDAFRYLRLREQPGQENAWQLSTVSPEHMGFGYGEHACPGRFFAANEIKVALVHLLMKYDWRFPPGVTKRPDDSRWETQHLVSALAEVQYKRRHEEITL